MTINNKIAKSYGNRKNAGTITNKITNRIEELKIGLKPPYESEEGYQKRAKGFNQAINKTLKIIKEETEEDDQ